MKTTLAPALAISAALAVTAPGAIAGGFAIGTQSGSGTGNAFAGGAAAAEDAGTAWHNPAGLALLPPGRHVSASLHALKPSFRYEDRGSSGAFAAPGTGEGGDGGDWALVPNLAFASELHSRWRFGIALNVPFGLATEYDDGWRGQLTALKTEIKTVNINPSLAYRVSDAISVGAGVSAQRLEAELTSFAGAAGRATLEADDVGYGYNVGITVQVTPATRIGASYRSKIELDLEGTAAFSGAPPLDGGVRADLELPDSASFSVFHTLGPKWELMGDLTWTGWSSLQQLTVVRTTASAGGPAGSVLTTLPFHWKDTWRAAAGANYKLDGRTKLRFGVAFDETPTNDVDRTPRLPDQDRTWIAFGVQYRTSEAGTFDLGYAHEFVRDAQVNTTAAPLTCPPHCLRGSFENKADILSVQYSHSF
ncbi:MAG TPA: outer membrane protein transport protein [Burkholderiales bacterium]|nr:outer membrane protein transport protein [Burkholderiales bacterium]